jgi:hypothetical protein
MPSMNNTESKSEVARIRALIALEYEAVQQGMKGMATTARHDFIRQRQQTILCYIRDLSGIIGESEATRLAFESCLDIDK